MFGVAFCHCYPECCFAECRGANLKDKEELFPELAAFCSLIKTFLGEETKMQKSNLVEKLYFRVKIKKSLSFPLWDLSHITLLNVIYTFINKREC